MRIFTKLVFPLKMTIKSTPFLLAAALAVSVATLRADPAPSWQLQDINGKSVKLSDFKGKVVVLDFWATWCGPCRAEIPSFIDLQDKYKDKGLAVIGVSLDQGGAPMVSSFVKSNKMNYTVVMGNEDIAHAYGDIQAIPTTFIIDPKGDIVGKHEGVTDKSVFEAEIQKVLPTSVAVK